MKFNRFLNFLVKNFIDERSRLTIFESFVNHYDFHNLKFNDYRIFFYKKIENIKNYYDDHSE